MSILKVQQLSAAPILKDISFTIDAGEIVAVIGPNGSGKSTLLNAISDNSFHKHSSIVIDNEASSVQQRAKQIATLPQLSLLNFPYRVFEVIQLARIPHCTGKIIDAQIIDDVLAAMDITDLKERIYTQLSGGEKQRVQLARVLCQIWRAEDAPSNTRLLLLDEPTAALDLGHQQQLMSAINDFAKQGVAVMMVLHDINLAARFADKILALLDGQSIAFDSTHNVITADIIKQLFNVDVQINTHPKSNTPTIVNL